MKNIFKTIIGLVMITGVVMTSCVKDEFDQPEVPNPCDITSGLTPNITIEGIGTLFASLNAIDASEVKIFPDSNIVLEAKVVSSDETGNFYKAIYLEDATGAVMLSIEGSNLFNDYPVGQTVHLNLSGLTIEFDDWVSIHEIGMGTYMENGSIKGIGRMPVTDLANHLKNNSCKTELTPTIIDLLSNDNSKLGRLVKIENVQFAATDTAKTYADAVSNPPQNVSLTVEDCNGNTIILRNSGYASFAGLQVPTGKGSITGIYTKYGSDYQLVIRDTEDVQFDGTRCGDGGGNGGSGNGAGTFADPYDIEAAMSNQDAGTGVWVQGFIVGIMDVTTDQNNFTTNLTAPFASNSNIYIAPTASETDTTKMLIVQLPSGDIRNATNLVDNESLLGKEIKYHGDLLAYFAVDGMKNTDGYWLIEADTGIDPDYVAPGTIWSEDFSTIANPYDPITSMTVVMEAGTKDWHGDGYNGQSAEMSAYETTNPEASNIGWLITPAIDLTSATAPKLTFYSALKYHAGDLLTVWISTDYDGGTSPQTATWTELTTANIVGSSDPVDSSSGYNFTTSGDVDLSSYTSSSTVYIAWKYTGSGTGGQTTKYRVDDIRIGE